MKQAHVVATMLVVMGCVVALADLGYEKHAHVKYEAWFNFFGFAGLAAAALLCLTAQVVRPLLVCSEEDNDG